MTQMNSKDVQLTRLTRNLHELAAAAAASTNAQKARVTEAVNEAKAQYESGGKKSVKEKRGRAAVVSWDLGHNPVGRAYVLYKLLAQDWNVDLVGPMWSRFGKELWAPLKNENLNIRSFSCDRMEDFVPKAELLAASKTYDLVYVCKPRLPSLYLGSLIKQSSNCPMVLDVDDFELSFFERSDYADFEEIQADLDNALHEPYEELATRYCQSLVSEADVVTVSNIALRERFGGHIVRHARDESLFKANAETRAAGRERLGIVDDEFALVFLGTPRIHKGVGEVARALHEIGDDKIVFHVVGQLTDQRLARQIEQYPNARLTFHPNCEFDELPGILAAADLVPLIQDPEHPVSQHQIPAKISDALSLGIPVLATATPPLLDFIAQGAINQTDLPGLAAAIVNQRDIAASGKDTAADCRRAFLGELGMSINRSRLGFAISEARPISGPLSDALTEMLSLFRQAYINSQHQRTLVSMASCSSLGKPKNFALDKQSGLFKKRLNRGVRRCLPGLYNVGSNGYDIAFFWKQNDSGMYGRRSDMIAKYLAASGRVNKMVHFDAPQSVNALDQHFNADKGAPSRQQDLILKNIFDRLIGVKDDVISHRRTFMNSSQPKRGTMVGEPVARPEEYASYVRRQLDEAGMRPETTYAWFCPVIWNAPELVDNIGFAGVISDLIDDQRAWDTNRSYAQKLDTSYADTLERSDIVFANCQPLADAMSEYADSIHVIPNGAERFVDLPALEKPEALKNIPGPIAGYVGNLRDRIDWLLLQDVVSSMPKVSFVFLGPSDNNPNADSLAKFPNVHMLGVVEYDQVPAWLHHFDVGMMPHLNNRLTERMNPLKIYNYFAGGLPMVSTEVNNLGLLGDDLQVASDAQSFATALAKAIDNPPNTKGESWKATMDSIAWDTRVNDILDVMDGQLRSRFKLSA